MGWWERATEGCLMVDHRASPGLNEEQSRAFGFDPWHTREGRVFEAATYTCPHFPCGTIVIIEPRRNRERAYCRSCNAYICDNCALEALQPDYVHITMDEAKERIKSGRWMIIGRKLVRKVIYG